VYYANVDALIQAVIYYYDDTKDVSADRQGRILHYVNRVLEEIWNYRQWNFKYGNYAITFTGGVGQCPDGFEAVGPNGGLYDSVGELWAEAELQEVLHLRQAGTLDHYYAVGDWDTQNEYRYIYIPDVNNADTFTLIYNKTAPTLSSGDLLPVPPSMHEAVFAGTVMHVQKSKNDERDWRGDFLRALSRAAIIERPNRSRGLQLPYTVGRMW
jgi:hypothetical protein